MIRNGVKILLGLSLFVFTFFKALSQSRIIADRYDKKKNQTILIILPYGNINIPDRWKKTDYNPVSKQYFFRNSDSTTIAIAKNPKEKYPFYKADQSDKIFIAEFVKWDAEYWEKQGMENKILTDNSDQGYTTWQVLKNDVNTILLFGLKKGLVYNFSVTSATWIDKKKEEFLIQLFNSN